MSETAIILSAGVSLALILGTLGVLLRFFQCHGLIAGYNTASPEEKSKYDVEGLSHHLGNGLMTLGVLLLPGAVAAAVDSLFWCLVILVPFLLVVLIIVLGGQKFTPRHTQAASRNRQPARHPFLRWLLPQKAFEAIRRGTKLWLRECPCGHKIDFWDAGGVRYKAVGEPRTLAPCSACGKATWQRVRKKSPAEQVSFR